MQQVTTLSFPCGPFLKERYFPRWKESRKLLIEPVSPFAIEVQQKVEDSIEYWKIGEVLDLYKVLVPADLIGQAKQVKRYRDWVAHKNPKKPSPAKITAELAYEVLASVLQQLYFAMSGSSDI